MAKLELPEVVKTLNIDGSQTYKFLIGNRLVSELKLSWYEIMDPSVFWPDKVKQWINNCTDQLREEQSNDQTIKDSITPKP
jgi:hypothetical protein